MSAVLPAAPLNIFPQGRTSGSIANFSYMEARGTSQIQRSWNPEEAPNVKGYGLDDGKQKLDALNYYSCNNSRNAIIANRGVHSGGSGRVEMAQVIDQDHDNTMENYVANIRAQFKVVPRRFGLGAMEVPPEILESGHLSSGLQTLYHEPAGATEDVIPSSSLLSSGVADSELSPEQWPAGPEPRKCW
ncbi:hypothetical protein ACET3Z_001997 [Daucus carota]